MIKMIADRISLAYERFLTFESPRSLVYGFLIIILIGTILLLMPFASKSGTSIGLIGAFFTATSAVCVTGLVVVNTLEHWTLYGKIVILLLIQIGGISFMSIVTGLFVLLGKKITLKGRLLIKESFNLSSISGLVKLVMNVIKGTFIIEGSCALLLAIKFFLEGDNFITSIGKGIFISISAFCNAGFDIIGYNSLTPYVGDTYINVIIMFLIISGGIGFTVWMDLLNIREVFKKRISTRIFLIRLSLHTKIALVVTGILIVSGFLVTIIFEYNNPNTIGQLSFGDKIMASLFQSVTLRTAGFNSFNLSELKDSTKLFYILEMFIGGSPGGTAGGVKTVTVGVVMIAIISFVRGNNEMIILKKTLYLDALLKSLAVIMLNISSIIVATMILSATSENLPSNIEFLDLLFESASAVGTVGLTLGVTPNLTAIGKITIAICMFIGRLGPVTLAVAFYVKLDKKKSNINYPSEKILVG